MMTTRDFEGLPGRLKLLRSRRKLTQRALAEAVGVSAATIANIELGKRSPSVETLARWFSVCGLHDGDMELVADFALLMALADKGLKQAMHTQLRALIDDVLEDSVETEIEE